MAFYGLRTLLGALTLFLTAAAIAGTAEAATIYSYNFIQEFDVSGTGVPPDTVPLSGHFAGTADALGYINRNTLTDFHLEIPVPNYPGAYSAQPDFFSFQIGDPSGSTLAFRVSGLNLGFSSAQLCVGVAVGVLCSGGTSRGVYQFTVTSAVIARSEVAPVVTLVSSTSPVATTPIPGALFLFATALGGAGAVGVLRRRAPA
jgi:hypothetical protein